MIKKKILYKDGFNYWRFEDVTIDDRIIKAFRKYCNDYNKKYRIKNISKKETDLFTNVKTENKQPLKERVENKNKMLSVKQAIKCYKVSDSTIRRFIRENKKVNPNKIMISKGKIYIDKSLLDSEFNLKVEGQKEEIGLIRKFIKWLW
jgi:DNA invertase Pin-like site-specific DNA recombinase